MRTDRPRVPGTTAGLDAPDSGPEASKARLEDRASSAENPTRVPGRPRPDAESPGHDPENPTRGPRSRGSGPEDPTRGPDGRTHGPGGRRPGPEDTRAAGSPRLVEQPRPGSSADLRRRSDHLRPGHPSSPLEADGRRKPPVPRLQDIALPEPLTDAEHAEHVKDIRDRLDKARVRGLYTEQQHTIDPDNQIWSDERDELHDVTHHTLFRESLRMCQTNTARSWQEASAVQVNRPSSTTTQASIGHSI